MELIYVVSKSGKPLMPTRRIGKVKRLLNKGRARIKSHHPFTIQMKYETGDKTQPLYGGIDPGRTNIGLAVIDGKGNVLYRAHVTTRNKDVTRLMTERRQHRMASRRGERLRRKRRAKAHHTLMAGGSADRRLPGYKDGIVTVKDIINTEARFSNRLRSERWITPTVRQLTETHISAVRLVEKILPVADWTIEVNKFAFMAMENGGYYGVDFTSGRMKGYSSADDYVYARQEGKCLICGRPIEHYHHVIPRHRHGSDLPENIVGLCRECHVKVHTGKLGLAARGVRKKYAALSALNQAIPYILKELAGIFGEEHIHGKAGYETAEERGRRNLTKDHDIDAAVIAGLGMNITLKQKSPECFEVKQFRRHDRQLVRSQRERTYYLPKSKKPVCKNRHKRFEQEGDSLAEFRRRPPEDVGRLTVKKSARYYNNPGRLMPGTVFEYRGEHYILTGQLSHGLYYRALGENNRNFPAKECRILCQNRGLLYT